jgi:hypothetical protein
MDIVKMVYALIVEGDTKVLDALEIGFWLLWSQYIDGAEVSITRIKKDL